MKRALSVYLPMWSIDLVRRRMKRAMGRHFAAPPDQITRSPDRQIARSICQLSIVNRQSPPILLTETKANRDLVVSCCEICLDAGVKPGMTLAHARALLPSIEPHIEPYAPVRDLKCLHGLAQWMIRFVPIVAIDPPDGLLLDITGCERLYKGERNLINRIADSTERRGFHIRIAAAPTFACARALAHCGRRARSMVPADRIREALAPLPMRALGIDAETEDALREIAIDRIGHVFDLPRNSLPARFGGDLLFRLDQALGQAIETIDPVRPAPPPEVERLFNGPVKQLEAIEITVRELLEDLSRELLQRESGVRGLVLTLDRSDLDPLHTSIALSHPTRNVKHLRSLLLPHVERAHMGFGIERVALRAAKVDRLPHEQGEIENAQTHKGANAQTSSNRNSLASPCGVMTRARGELLDTLINRLNCGSVSRLLPVESHIPERAFRMGTVMEERKRPRDRETKRRSAPLSRAPKGERWAHQSSIVHRQSSIPSITSHDRPTVLFDHPELIDVLAVTPESPPSLVTWRAHSYEVLFGCGPERIGEVWWEKGSDEATERRSDEGKDAGPDERREDGPGDSLNRQSSLVNRSIPLILLQRSYYRVQLEDGRFLWVFRQLVSGRWFVHGEWV